MTSCADQCADARLHRKNADARARKYSITGTILQDCHKLKQSTAHNGIVMMQMQQARYGPQRQRDDIESASVISQSTTALYHICRKRDMGNNSSVIWATTASLYHSQRQRDIVHVASVICQYAGCVIQRYDDMVVCLHARQSIQQ